MLKLPYLYSLASYSVFFFHATYPFFHFTEQKSRTNPSPYLTSSCFPPNHPAPVPPVGQQPSGRPEEEKPLGVSQWDRGSTGAHLPPAGLRCSSNPAAGRHQPHRRVRPRPLPPDLRSLQPSLLVHLPGQGHHGGRQVQRSHLVIMVHLHLSWYCYFWGSLFLLLIQNHWVVNEAKAWCDSFLCVIASERNTAADSLFPPPSSNSPQKLF